MEKNLINQNLELVKVVFAGSVDDGKSTLIGRLFHDTNQIYRDQLAAIKTASARQGSDNLDLSLFTDGLVQEREQKITIDVAHRYFSTPFRRFIIADVPGHEEYTRNMVSGSSGADVAVILVDAQKGLVEQTKRHLFIVSLLKIPHLLVVINKMDLVAYRQEEFEKIRNDFISFAAKLNISDLQFIPVSALTGELIVEQSERLPWYHGPTVLGFLENLELTSSRNLIDFRFPVQLVLRPDQNFRGYAGTIVSGEIKKNEEVMILPSGKKAKIKSIIADQKETELAFCPQPVVIELDREISLNRGEMLVRPNNLCEISQEFEAMVFWLAKKPARKNQRFLIKQTTKTTTGFFDQVIYQIEINTLHRKQSQGLAENQVGKVIIKTLEPLLFDPYQKNKATGSFIMIDEETNNTVGAGIILGSKRNLATTKKELKSRRATAPVLWFTGLSGAGKTTIADRVKEKLEEMGLAVERIDGDDLRQLISSDLGFSAQDRDRNIARAVYLCQLLSKHGVIVLATFISPYSKQRELVKSQVGNFIEIFVNAPLEICEKRDVKGLYQKARRGEVEYFTGIADGYEKPKNPELELKTDKLTVDQSIDKVIDYLTQNNLI